VSTGYLGKSFLTGQASLCAGQLRELAAAGIDFGSHTVTHPRLCTLPAASIRHELRASREVLEDLLDREIRSFSYPYRFPEEDRAFVALLRAMLIEGGYSLGVTTRIGRARSSDDPLFMKRLPVNDSDDDELFRAKLDGAYDWLHTGQLLYKRARSIPSNCRRFAAEALAHLRAQ
jgi:peptidoglycan/xylan/chitin deacetylase (PgdA/CDA1 family)